MTQKIKFIIQDTIIDLSKPSYTVSQNTEGTRDKANITGINDHQNLIENNRPVLFKKARIKDRRIPEDIWGEVLAYWIGSQLSIPIARAYIAKKDGEFGCISEYVFCDQRYSMHIARETLIKHKSDYDFKSSKDHSIELIQQSFENIKIEDFNDSFTQMILFDLLIGNTDRHQDNWAILQNKNQNTNEYKFSPLYDNGSCLMLSNKIEKLNPKKFEKYFSETTSKLKINSSDKKFARSDQLIELALGLSQNACKEFNKKLSELNEILPLLKNKLTNLNESLTKSDNMIPVICGPRRDFIFNYLSFRIKELKSNLPI